MFANCIVLQSMDEESIEPPFPLLFLPLRLSLESHLSLSPNSSSSPLLDSSISLSFDESCLRYFVLGSGGLGGSFLVVGLSRSGRGGFGFSLRSCSAGATLVLLSWNGGTGLGGACFGVGLEGYSGYVFLGHVAEGVHAVAKGAMGEV